MLRPVGYEPVDIRFVMSDDGESLPNEFVCDGDHCELPGFSVLSEPCVSFSALCIESACRPCGEIEQASGVCVSVPVDVSPDVYGGSGLFVSGTDTEIPGHLLGILEVSEAACGDNECRSERYADSFDRCQEVNLHKVSEFSTEPAKPLFEKLNGLVHCMDCTLVRDRKTNEGTTEVRHGGNLLGELTYDRSFLAESQDGVTLHLERLRIHLLPIQGNEPGIDLVRLDRGEHGSGEILYLQRVFHTDRDSGSGEQIQQHCAVIPCRFHDTVDTAVFRKSSDELPNPCGRVVESVDFPAFVRGVGNYECSLAHVDSNVLHDRLVFSSNDICYILVHHCKYGFKHLTNYPDSDVKSMGSEHFSRSRRPMKTRTYSIL